MSPTARCNCTDGPCSCLVTAGDGVTVTGTGSPTDPYVITMSEASTSFTIEDTSSVNLTLQGQGTPADPYILSAQATLDLTALADVVDGETPANGDVPTWTVAGWVFAPPAVPPGSVTVSPGLLGDGSGGDPLTVDVSGLWGFAPLEGPDSTVGQLIYVDSAGQLRAEPIGAGTQIPWDNISGKPSAFPTTWSQVSAKPVVFPTNWSQVASKPATFPSAWATTSGRPSLFPPQAHNHDLTDIPEALARVMTLEDAVALLAEIMLQASVAAATYMTVIVHDGVSWPARPGEPPDGHVTWIGPTEPDDALPNDPVILT